MCPLYPFHILILYLCLMLPLLLAVVEAAESIAGWNLSFSVLGNATNTKDGLKFREEMSESFGVTCDNCDQEPGKPYTLTIKNHKPENAYIDYNGMGQQDDGSLQIDISEYANSSSWELVFNVTGTFLGFSKVSANVETTGKKIGAAQNLQLTVTRSIAKKTASKIFGYSVAVLISLAYINMGCALDLDVMKQVLKRPVGPAIGFVSQFLFMPIISFVLGYILPFNSPSMRLGLFVTGASPGGGASNIWTVLFGGNLDLSVTMTAVSTMCAFFMMPMWMMTLGQVIISNSDIDIVVPYYKIITYGIMMIVPLSIGIGITRCLPKVSKFLVKVMKPLALFLILFILTVGIWSQFFMFKLMSWHVLVVGFALPWLGFAFGCLTSKACGRPREDIIAIAIETGVQNTGMAIFMLWFTLDHPAGDLAAVIPVAVATMTPLPLLAALVFYKMRARYCPIGAREDIKEMEDDSSSPEPSIIKQKQLVHSESGAPLMGCPMAPGLKLDKNANV